MNKSSIDYLKYAQELIGRPGYSLNIVTGCKHHETGVCKVPCYAKRLVETRLKDSPSYPYGFKPTFHPERIRHYGGKPKLIFLNDLGDVGGGWNWQTWKAPDDDSKGGCASGFIAMEMVRFAHLNPEHIILLLTKNPAWYGLVEWPENVWCGFTATNNDELISRYRDTVRAGCLPRIWGSYEPWLDDMMPHATGFEMPQWTVIGGQSRPDRPVSEATLEWLRQPMDAKRFVKRNAFNAIDQKWDKLTTVAGYPREYPAEWGVESCSGQ